MECWDLVQLLHKAGVHFQTVWHQTHSLTQARVVHDAELGCVVIMHLPPMRLLIITSMLAPDCTAGRLEAFDNKVAKLAGVRCPLVAANCQEHQHHVLQALQQESDATSAVHITCLSISCLLLNRSKSLPSKLAQPEASLFTPEEQPWLSMLLTGHLPKARANQVLQAGLVECQD